MLLIRRFTIIFFLLTMLTACFESNSIENDEFEHESVYTIEYGFNINGNHVDNGTLIKPNNDGAVSGSIKIKSDIPEERDYKLLILDNYKQTVFSIDGNDNITSFAYTMPPNSEKEIPVTIPIKNDTKELTVMTIKMPDYLLKVFDINRASILEEALVYRLPVENNETYTIEFENPDFHFDEGPTDFLAVSTEANNIRTTVTEKSGTDIYITTGNLFTEEDLTYAIAAFKDWQQTEVLPGKEVLYVKVPYEERFTFQKTLPDVNKDTNIQYFAFPFPYEVSQENYFSQSVFGSFRLVVEP